MQYHYLRQYPMHSPLGYTARWSPFRLDALGLLTMLGGPEMSLAVGNLTFNRITEFLPILGAYTVPSNDFTEPLSGFTLYNVTDSIMSSSLSGWFSRWLLAQKASENNTKIVCTVHHQIPRKSKLWVALAIGVSADCITTLLPFLLGDWYGLASAICIDTSIFVRWYLVKQNRTALDHAATDEDNRRNQEMVKTLCFLRDNKVVTVLAPRNVVINCFLSRPKPRNHRIYSWVRALGWISFAGFVVTIGQATLIVQLVIVSLTLFATVLTARGTSSNVADVGDNMKSVREERHNLSGRRIQTYSALNLSPEEEDTMVDWNLVPQRKNIKWWDEYRALQYKGEIGKPYRQPLSAKRVEDQIKGCTEKAEFDPQPLRTMDPAVPWPTDEVPRRTVVPSEVTPTVAPVLFLNGDLKK